ncbi:uncharacterized protein LOC135076445 isoform X2 [Ostrinia nubilalis]|uniref:uncharacterized protein LOC135076445 isoform X2 n=1 Tax=Ostrinia nubilalis TaxID=29057 RepID=UPI003082429F
MLGLSFGSPTVAVAQLRARANSTDAVSREMGSWIASASGFVAIPTVVISVIVVHHFGRKKLYNYATVKLHSGLHQGADMKNAQQHTDG